MLPQHRNHHPALPTIPPPRPTTSQIITIPTLTINPSSPTSRPHARTTRRKNSLQEQTEQTEAAVRARGEGGAADS
jgi:hypothetical protein